MNHRHICGWYYGEGHLLAKILPFVIDGLDENAQFLLCYEESVLRTLRAALTANGHCVRPETLVAAPILDWCQVQRTGGVQGLRRALLTSLEAARSQGFHTLRVSGQVRLELDLTRSSLAEFLQWEQVYHQASYGLPVSSLCLYDAALPVDRHALHTCHDECLHDPTTFSVRDLRRRIR